MSERLAIGLEKGWTVKVNGKTYEADLPATLDLLGIGEPNSSPDLAKLSRKNMFAGKAVFSRDFNYFSENKSVFLFLERTRVTRAWLNSIEIFSKESRSLSTPHIYELEGIEPGTNRLDVEVDNNFEDSAILSSHAATEETQTNWNGLIGRIELQVLPKIRIDRLRVQAGSNNEAKVAILLANDSDENCEGTIELASDGFKQMFIHVSIQKRGREKVEAVLEPKGTPGLWSEFEPTLHVLKACLLGHDCLEETFGLRIASSDPSLCLNGKRIFLRSEANCAVFPLTGCAPMDEGSWEKLFAVYKSYGVNAVRFHSWCPPEAAFRVADRMGLYLQPELSCWNCENLFGTAEDRSYYKAEAEAILDTYGGHPSFLMLSLGNELKFSDTILRAYPKINFMACESHALKHRDDFHCATDEILGYALNDKNGLEYADHLLKELKEKDPSKLYTFASNGYYGYQPPTEHSEYFHAQTFGDLPLRGAFSGNTGQIYEKPPETLFNYEAAVKKLSVPAISFEVGQYQVFPDVLDEPARYTGPLEPRNFTQTLQSLREKGFSDTEISTMIEASGELSFLGYRQEIEAALRTPGLSGISLLGLQDFPGQGTALVGMMNALGNPKPYPFADPARFKRFFAPVAALAEISRFVWKSSDKFSFEFLVANYGPSDLSGEASWQLCAESGAILAKASEHLSAPQGRLTRAQKASVSLASVLEPARLTLELAFETANASYDIWVYPEFAVYSRDGSDVRDVRDVRDVLIVSSLGEEALARLESGGKVLLSPNPCEIAKSVPGQFETAFWSTIFGAGTLGISVDPKHPVFKEFPTFSHSSFQWFNLTKNGRPMILDGLADLVPLVKVIDGFSTLRRLGLLYEAMVGNGKLMVSSLGLEEGIANPEVRALRESILDYMESDQFNPVAKLAAEEIAL
ncbi:MAG: hypothetical protein LBT59_14320 [Clostridiales bacterium]|jgi:hypothetical protein|nr:hypothetical protein [Clostridiales bacterium]